MIETFGKGKTLQVVARMTLFWNSLPPLNAKDAAPKRKKAILENSRTASLPLV
jgi:hypothetical protein